MDEARTLSMARRERVLPFDPLDEYLKPCLQGFRLIDGEYHALPEVNNSLQSESLGLTLSADGNRLALTETATGKRLLQAPRIARGVSKVNPVNQPKRKLNGCAPSWNG